MIIKNSIIPFKGFKAINLFGLIFVRKESSFNQFNLNHERIHTAQILECGIVFFYIIYLLEFLWNLILYRNRLEAYFNISFECEAYSNMYNLDYLKTRKHYSWL